MSPQPAHAVHRERLSVPLRWWALATLFLASLLIAFLVATPAWLAFSATALLVAVVVGVFLGWGSARVTVSDGVLRAGRANIAVSHLGAVQPLDASAMRLLAGREADARAYLLIRPYLRRGVRVDIVDPGDPAPYWLLSSRRPDRLAAALTAAGAADQPRGPLEEHR